MSKLLNIFLLNYKKLQRLFAIKSYVVDRIKILIKNIFKFKQLYKFEENTYFDKHTNELIIKIKKDLPTFKPKHASNRWENVSEKEKTGNSIAKNISKIIPLKNYNDFENELRNINEYGFSKLENLTLNHSDIDETLKFVETKNVYPSHVPWLTRKKSENFDEIKNSKSVFASYDLEVFFPYKHILKIICNPLLSNLVSNYFGCLPTINNANLYWTLIGKKNITGPLNFHRDVDDHKIVNFFLFLTDTNLNDGSHCYIKKTHNLKKSYEVFDEKINEKLPRNLNPFVEKITPEKMFDIPFHGYGNNELYKFMYEKNFEHLYGKAGSSFITDGYGLHKSCYPLTKDRLILWVTFSLTTSVFENNNIPNQKRINWNDIKSYLPDTIENKYIFRNLVDFSNK